MPKRPMTATMKSKPFMRSMMPKVMRSCAGHDVEPDRGQDEAEEDGDERLERAAAAQPDEGREREELDGEELGRAELQRELGEERREERDEDHREQRARRRTS